MASFQVCGREALELPRVSDFSSWFFSPGGQTGRQYSPEIYRWALDICAVGILHFLLGRKVIAKFSYLRY